MAKTLLPKSIAKEHVTMKQQRVITITTKHVIIKTWNQSTIGIVKDLAYRMNHCVIHCIKSLLP